MRVLLIKLKHIGDSLLLTPTVDAIKTAHPEAEIWVLVRDGCQGILAGCPAIDRILTASAPERHNRSVSTAIAGMRLAGTLLQHRFDYVFELSDGDRGRWLSAFARTRKRCTNAGVRHMGWGWRRIFNCVADFDWLGMHSVEKDFRTVSEFLPLSPEPPPLCFSAERTEPWPLAEGLDDFVFLHPATRWECKEWPAEKWLDLGQTLLKQVSRLVLSCGPDEAEVAATRQLAEKLGDRVLFTEGQLSWRQMAWMLQRARLFVGVDTAAMHLAAACQCPVVAIFGPSVPWVWSPWQVRCEVIAPAKHERYGGVFSQFQEVAGLKMADVPTERVIEACRRLIRDRKSAKAANDEDKTDEGHCIDVRE